MNLMATVLQSSLSSHICESLPPLRNRSQNTNEMPEPEQTINASRQMLQSRTPSQRVPFSSVASVSTSGPAKRQRVLSSPGTSTCGFLNSPVSDKTNRTITFTDDTANQSSLDIKARFTKSLYSGKHIVECILSQFQSDDTVLQKVMAILGEDGLEAISNLPGEKHNLLARLAVQVKATLSSIPATGTSTAAQYTEGRSVSNLTSSYTKSTLTCGSPTPGDKNATIGTWSGGSKTIKRILAPI